MLSAVSSPSWSIFKSTIIILINNTHNSYYILYYYPEFYQGSDYANLGSSWDFFWMSKPRTYFHLKTFHMCLPWPEDYLYCLTKNISLKPDPAIWIQRRWHSFFGFSIKFNSFNSYKLISVWVTQNQLYNELVINMWLKHIYS